MGGGLRAPRENVGPFLLAGVCVFFDGHGVTVEEASDSARCEDRVML